MTEVVIIGTGLISKFHEEAIRQIPGLSLAAKCSRMDDWDAALSRPGVGLCLVANACRCWWKSPLRLPRRALTR